MEQNGEWFNFSDLLETSDSTLDEVPVPADPNRESSTEEPSTREPYGITINNINLIDCHLLYSDLILNHTITLQDIDLHIPGFTLRSGSTDLAVDFDFAQGGRFYSELSFNQSDSSYALTLQLDSLNIDIIEPYIKNTLDIAQINGYFTNDILLRGDLRHIAAVHLSGWNQVHDLLMTDRQDREILSFKQLVVVVDTVMLDRNQIRLGEISLEEPFVLFELIDTTNNWLAMMVPQDSLPSDPMAAESMADTTAADDTGGFDFSMAHLSMQDGRILFYDRTLRQDFQAEIHDINIDSRGLGTGSTEVNINLNAELNQTARVQSDIILNPQQMDDLQIKFDLENFIMNDLEPYMVHYFGYPIEEGMLAFSTSNDIAGKKISSDNKLQIRQLELGKPDKSNAEIKLPLRLALGILSDRNGLIEMDIPVRTKDEGTSITNLGRLILKTIGNLVVKAATSPVELLSSMFETDPGKLKEVQGGMFDRMPDEEGMESLDLIAEILEEKPKLRVKFHYAMDREAFADSLSYLLAVEAFRDKSDSLVLLDLAPLPDSLLQAFLRKELSQAEVPEEVGLRDLCIRYTGASDLAERYDSVRLEQSDFVSDYLQENKGLPSDRFTFDYELPDTLPPGRYHALMHVVFQSLDSPTE